MDSKSEFINLSQIDRLVVRKIKNPVVFKICCSNVLCCLRHKKTLKQINKVTLLAILSDTVAESMV